jgi:hypothetical protein
MSDLMGPQASSAPPSQVPYSLHEFADEEELPEADLYVLASIQFRGEHAPSAEWIARGFVARSGIGSADLVGEPVAGGLPGYAERDRDPVPAPPAGSRRRDPLGHQGLVAADLLGGLG